MGDEWNENPADFAAEWLAGTHRSEIIYEIETVRGKFRLTTDALTALQARLAAVEAERDAAREALADLRATPYAPWTLTDDKGNVVTDPEDTLGAMIDNQAWVMMSHIASYIGHRDGHEDLMEDWQEDWAENYPNLLKGWFSPHRACASYVADRLALKGTDHG